MKTGTSFRLSLQAVRSLPELAAHMGLSQASTLELIVRRAARMDPAELFAIQRRNLEKVERYRAASTPMGAYPYRLSDEARDLLDTLTHTLSLPSQAELVEILLFEWLVREGISPIPNVAF